MTVPNPEPDLQRYYSATFSERDRLLATPHGRLEYLRTQEIIRRFLPEPPATVLDIGGGPGAHAQWLAQDGFRVHLIDPVPAHVAQAATLDRRITTSLGDARHLAVADESVDAVVMLGPLYHLTDREDRLEAIRQAIRAARPNAPVCVAAISRHSLLLDLTRQGRLNAETLPIVRAAMRTGWHDPRLGFTTAYLHTAEELRAEMAESGLSELEVFGVEGPAWQTLYNDGGGSLPAILQCAREAERDPAMLSASQHLLAVGRR